MRCFVNGVEIDKIKPRLSCLDLEDPEEGIEKFLDWATSHYPNAKWEAIFDRVVEGSDEKALLESLWIGGIPEEQRRGVDPGRIQIFSRRGPWSSMN